MPTLFILSGLPFSGKSTFAKQAENSTSLKRVSFDDLWKLLETDDENMTYERAITEIEKLISSNLEKGDSILYDSTNLKVEHRMVLIDLAKSIDAECSIIYFSISIDEMRRRQAESLITKTHHEVWEKNIQAAIEHNIIPENCVLLENEEDKEKLLEKMRTQFPMDSLKPEVL